MISLLPAHAPGFFPSPFETSKGYHMLSADSKFTGVYLFAIFHYRMSPTYIVCTGSTNQECLAKRAEPSLIDQKIACFRGRDLWFLHFPLFCFGSNFGPFPINTGSHSMTGGVEFERSYSELLPVLEFQ